MNSRNTDCIEKQIELQVPCSRVWRALTDSQEFGRWFRVDLEGPFVPGAHTRGAITHPGYEHLVMDVEVQQMEPERLFSLSWHPHSGDPHADYSTESPTLVEFTLTPIPEGTLLTVTESGFDALPAERRAEAFRMNERGWTEQMKNIHAYLNDHP